MFHVPEKYRMTNRHSRLFSDASWGNNGFFVIPHNRIHGYVIYAQVSDGMGWEHVSVSVAHADKKQSRCPTWEEMCHVKSLFWDEEDCIIEYHPAKSEYVNMHPFVLHLWRPTDQVIPIPDKIMVGI
jgi:hypothetical protein